MLAAFYFFKHYFISVTIFCRLYIKCLYLITIITDELFFLIIIYTIILICNNIIKLKNLVFIVIPFTDNIFLIIASNFTDTHHYFITNFRFILILLQTFNFIMNKLLKIRKSNNKSSKIIHTPWLNSLNNNPLNNITRNLMQIRKL